MVISLNKNIYYGTTGYYATRYPGISTENLSVPFATIHIQKDCKKQGGLIRISGKGELTGYTVGQRLDLYLRIEKPNQTIENINGDIKI